MSEEKKSVTVFNQKLAGKLMMEGFKLQGMRPDKKFSNRNVYFFCHSCGHKKKELALSERIYLCECGNRMDRDVNAAVNILKEGKRIYKKCA